MTLKEQIEKMKQEMIDMKERIKDLEEVNKVALNELDEDKTSRWYNS